MTTYTVALGKGGSTKTVTAAELVATLTRQGRRVLAIDLDQQGNLSTRLGITPDIEVTAVSADVLTGEADALEAAVEAPSVAGAHVLIGSHDLANVKVTEVPDLVTSLRDHLPSLNGQWDDVVIDTPPGLDDLSLAGLAAADTVVASVASVVECFDQVARLGEWIDARLGRRVRPGIGIDWIVLTRYDRRRRHDREIRQALEETYPGKVTGPVREGIVVPDSFIAGLPVSVYDSKSKVARDYAAALTPIVSTSTGE
ncbi:chromosome partitioning protein [Georgenia soli]|uniref:Chromosome partitioning protein n=1 Tax=Georgenia soli TaxID=638953 RepID=A0A2A9F3P1_9MICO|nr:ParA family protein [Georgenia soli]PFG45029.1 chromosome partitioning protein [Georgenia soli]